MGAQLAGWETIPHEEGWRKGPWTAEEDRLLMEYVNLHGEGRWNSVARLAGLKRNGKSCRLRWVNYLRPDLKRGRITPHEESIILELHARWGNRWSTIARSLPGRTDNEIKNYWRTHFKKKEKISPREQTEKSKARLLRRQQFQYQQQLQLQLQQQHEQQQKQVELEQQQQQQQQSVIRRLMAALLDDDNISTISNKVPPLAQVMKQDCIFSMCPNSTNTSYEDQCMISSALNMPTSENINGPCEEMLWSGLWNLDDNNRASFDGNGANINVRAVQAKITPFIC